MHSSLAQSTPARRRHRPASSIGAGALAIFLATAVTHPARAVDRLVSPFGSDTGDCSDSPCRTVQYALDRIGASDVSETVKVAQGVYFENVFVAPAGPDITVQGGWRPDWSARDPDPTTTVIDGSAGTGAVLSLWVPTSVVTVQGLTLQGGDTSGLALANRFGGEPTFVVEGVVIRLNETSAVGSGGGLRLQTSNSYGGTRTVGLQIRSTVIADNTAGNLGGGIFFDAGQGTRIAAVLTNATVSNNSAAFGGGGLAVVHLTGGLPGLVSLNLYNTILWGNEASMGADDLRNSVSGTNIVAFYSDIGDLDIGAGSYTDLLSSNVNVNPVFVDAGDYHLQPNSPLVDTGKCDLFVPDEGGYVRTATYVDLEGEPRPAALDAPGCDIGADEAMIFGDGFESGGTGAWLSVVP